MKTLSFTILFYMVSCLVSCKEPPTQNTIKQPAPTMNEQQVASSANSFGFQLFKTLSNADPADNTIVSPFSVSMALGMTLNGADNGTKTEMQNVLGFTGLSDSVINQSYYDIANYLTSIDPNVTFNNANSIWIRTGFTPLPSFINVNKNYFDAEVQTIDFSLPTAASTINGWVAQKTQNKIKEIVSDPIDPDDVMILLNALYFKGSWTKKFDSTLTRDDHFNSLAGTAEPCKMMNTEDTILYYGNDLYQAVDLPYSGKNFRMAIILPSGNANINSFLASFEESNWHQLLQSFHYTDLTLQLPRFTLSYKASLADVLKALGMPSAFDPEKADLSRIYPITDFSRLYITKVEHKTFVEVNEEGTEAAAVTSVEIAPTAIGPSQKIIVRVDHPFLFIIHETGSGAILFTGKVVSLSQ